MMCFTWKRALQKRVIIIIMSVLAAGALVIGVRCCAAASLGDGYQMESGAQEGTPQVPEEEQYAHVLVTDGFELDICGNPKIEGKKVYFYPTNPAGNDVWFKVAVLDRDGERIGESGILKQGQYTEYIELERVVEEETEVSLKVIAYEPGEYTSRGSITLETVLKP